ncbi:hypothetical protein GCM10010372_19690 [Streptomyces tauricus]|uniref:hypothetical protein n=1 Tax=Streptomyces tauricus TaxID=68274 RepID=UPI00167BC1C3|nr:hypothetical protein [Streptomyces tauricus]GHA19914.1 hypothetical protein GCM10010372_19690 [Streptomyces tauricus]
MHPMAIEQNFRMRAGRFQSWGIGLLIAASLFWIYAAWQVFTPYESTYNKVDCPAPFTSERRDLYVDDSNGWVHEDALRCASDRDWPEPLAALVMSVPLSAIGSALLTAGTVSVRLRVHDREMHEAQN